MSKANAVERFFTQIANDVLQSAEQIVNRMEDGISVIMTGKLPTEINDQDLHSQQQQDQDQQQAENDRYHFYPDNDNEKDQDNDNDDDDDYEFDPKDVEEMLRNNPLQGMTEQVLGDIMGSQSKPQTTWEHIQAFKCAITWTEPFIISIVAFQLIMFVATIWASRHNRGLTPRVILMVLIAGTVRMAEYGNTIAGRYWTKFATQNYFDRKGFFVLIMICVPLLVDSFIMLVSFLREASILLIQVKTKQLKLHKKKMNQQQQQEQQDQQGTSTMTMTTTRTTTTSKPEGSISVEKQESSTANQVESVPEKSPTTKKDD